jgi:hypothetical protein
MCKDTRQSNRPFDMLHVRIHLSQVRVTHELSFSAWVALQVWNENTWQLDSVLKRLAM